MTLNYIGPDSKTKVAEFKYSDAEEEQFLKIAELLENIGWRIDIWISPPSPIHVAWCDVRNIEEFNRLRRDWQKAKKEIK